MIFTLDHVPLQVEVVQSPEAQQRGLSGRKYLAKNTGMLFVFPKEDYYSFWMKDMLFPIDIIWMNKDYKIVYVKKDAQPCTLFSCPKFTPDMPAQYVLEVSPGTLKGL
ncbi:MAG: DUF192 domain-containing protein [Gammaproteobacteria bacterium]|nr:DUF192 domain-containing protein [Gammaproteobacteria bacterium]